MSTALMRQMIAAVDISYYDAVTKVLLKTGTTHFIKTNELAGTFSSEVNQVSPATRVEEVTSVRRRLETLLALAGIEPGRNVSLKVEELDKPQTEEAARSADNLSGEIEQIREKQRQIHQELMRLEELDKKIEAHRSISPELMQQESRLLVFYTGAVDPAKAEDFRREVEDIPAVTIPLDLNDSGEFVIIALRRQQARLDAILSRYGWREIDLQGGNIKMDAGKRLKLSRRVEELKEEQRGLITSVEELITNKKDRLLDLWKNLRLNELYSSIESNYGKTARTILFTGWVPRSQKETLDRQIRKACNNTCYIEWYKPEDAIGIEGSMAPVQLKNPKLLNPFQMLVENYSIPEYGTLDPTPLVAVAYLLMFGLMFGDVGHGLVLLLAGIAGTFMLKGKPIRRLFQLIIWCGSSAMVVGALFGSYFGVGLFPALWFDYHEAVAGHAGGGYVQDIYDILRITIIFGISIIGIGLLLNWINCIRKKRWVKLFLDKTGLLGGWIYGAGVYTAFYFGQHAYKELPPVSLLIWILGLPAVLFFLKPVVEFIIEKRDHGKKFTGFTIVDFIMEYIVEMLEIFSGYLANTLSFMRVAGLGIAHVSLMNAFFQIAGMIGGDGYNIGSYIILVFGNILVIGLEGLSAGIQSLRLNYYEFFSKYFSGSGIAYSPVSLKLSQMGGKNE